MQYRTCLVDLLIPLIASLFFRNASSSDVSNGESSSTPLAIVEGHSTTLNCASLHADNRIHGNGTFFFKWTAPNNVLLKEPSSVIRYDRSNISYSTVFSRPTRGAGKGESKSAAKSLVESTAEGNLIFHFPTKSVGGQYVCRSVSKSGETIREFPVIIRVIQGQEPGDDVDQRTKIGMIAAAVTIVLILVFFCVWRHRRKKKNDDYVDAKMEEMVKMKIPTITVLDVHGEKLEEESFDFYSFS